jgi:hypothetical protein
VNLRYLTSCTHSRGEIDGITKELEPIIIYIHICRYGELSNSTLEYSNARRYLGFFFPITPLTIGPLLIPILTLEKKKNGIIVCPCDKGMTHEDNNLRHGREEAYFEIIE